MSTFTIDPDNNITVLAESSGRHRQSQYLFQ